MARGRKTQKKITRGWCRGCQTVKKNGCFFVLPFCGAGPTQKKRAEGEHQEDPQRKKDNPGNPFRLHFHGRRKGKENVGISSAKRFSDERCAQHCGLVEVDGRMGVPKGDGMAA